MVIKSCGDGDALILCHLVFAIMFLAKTNVLNIV